MPGDELLFRIHDCTHRLMGKECVSIERDSVTTTSNIYAAHLLENGGDDIWVFIGDCQHQLANTDRGWKTTYVRENLLASWETKTFPYLQWSDWRLARNGTQ